MKALIRQFLYEQVHPENELSGADVDIQDCPYFTGQFSAYDSAVATYYLSSDTLGQAGFYRERIRATPARCQSHSTLWLPTCYERLLALSNPCWTLPVGCSLVHRGRVESTINLYPAKGKAMAMSATTTSLEWPD